MVISMWRKQKREGVQFYGQESPPWEGDLWVKIWRRWWSKPEDNVRGRMFQVMQLQGGEPFHESVPGKLGNSKEVRKKKDEVKIDNWQAGVGPH